MSFVDFAAVKAEYPINRVVDLVGLEMRMKGSQWRGKCPTCESDGDRNLVVTPEKGLFYCFTAEGGGDQLALVAHVNGCSVREAAEWLAGDNPQAVIRPKGDTKPKETARPSEGFSPLTYLEADHPAVEALGFDLPVAEALGIGYAKRGVLKGTVAIPLRRPDGAIAGYIGLTEIDKLPPKWELGSN